MLKKDQQNKLKGSLDRFYRDVSNALIDLTSLEVNSVIAHNISGDHPLNDQVFLQQICNDLVDWFETNKTEDNVQKPLPAECVEALSKSGKDENLGNPEVNALQDILEDVDRCLKHRGGELNAETGRKRTEYRRHLRYVQKYVQLYRSTNWNWSEKMLEGRDRNQLRKLWEMVGTAYVYAQTVVGLDGDIISRIHQQLLLSTEELGKYKAEELLQFHTRNVKAGADYRNNLMKTLVRMIGAWIGR